MENYWVSYHDHTSLSFHTEIVGIYGSENDANDVQESPSHDCWFSEISRNRELFFAS